MTGTSDRIGRMVVDYFERFGQRAPFAMADDLSRAIGRRDRAAILLLARVRLRFERLQWLGRFDDGRSRTALVRAQVADQRRRRLAARGPLAT